MALSPMKACSLVGYDESGVAEGSMGIDCGDYNGDGWLDLIVAEFRESNPL